MKISNENAYEKINILQQAGKGEHTEKSKHLSETIGGYTVDISGNKAVESGTYQKEKLTLDELSEKMGLPAQDLQKMYMAVMSNTASEEDFAKMMEDGYQVTDMDMDTMVTILDQIKVELAKAGTEVEGYTDTVDTETLEQIVGNAAYAQALTKGLEEPAMSYMLKNELPPTAENIYKATYSAGKEMHNPVEKNDWQMENDAAFLKQIDQVIETAGLEVTKENQDAAKFLMEHDIPLTEEMLQLYQQLKEFKQPLSTEELAIRIDKGLTKGQAPWQVNLSEKTTIYEQAVQLTEDVNNITDEDIAATIEDAKPVNLKNLKLSHKKVGSIFVNENDLKFLTARKSVEEVRLHMTVETNLRLMRKGIQIDTMPIQQLIEELENAQRQLEEMAIPKTTEVVEKMQQLPTMPMQVLGFAVIREIPFTISGLHEKGVELQTGFEKATQTYEPLQADYAKATEKYEQLQTAPRADMGDSIKKAFRNVDEILTDMGRELSEENRRAVRILGYNQIEITEENLQRAAEMDEKVQTLFKDLKPGRVLQMIREGVDVLHTDITQLDEYLTTMENSFIEESDGYARFLQKIEKAGDITVEERESYIGIYRLMRQVEKSDGAAMGYVMASEAELTLQNLLTAVRSDKRKQLDYLLDDSFAGVDKREMGKSITEQIQKAVATEQSVSFLEQFHQPVTIANLTAASSMLADGSGVYKELAKKDSESEFERYCDELADAMTDEDSLRSGFERFEKRTSDMLEKVMMTDDNTLVDVKAMQSMFKQIRLSTSLAKESYYQIPVKTEDDYTVMNVHVKHTGDAPSVEIEMEWGELGLLKAEYRFTEDLQISSHLQGQSQEAYALLEKVSLQVEEEFHQMDRTEKVSTRELCQMAKIFLQTIRKE